MNILKLLFGREQKPVSVIDVFKADPTPPSAWKQLQAMGYTYHETTWTEDGKRCAWIEKDGEAVSVLNTPQTFEQRYALREQFARQALKVLQK